MKKVLAAMSGGVDSAVMAATLLEAGNAVAGACMQLHDDAGGELHDAEATCKKLGIAFYAPDFREQFSRLVRTPFLEAYQKGLTPNPCVVCNQTVKFGIFLDYAASLGYDTIATGHYACIERSEAGRYLIRKARDAGKDQTYMLYSLTQKQLSHVLLPMGDMLKSEARQKAEAWGLPVAHKHDSQDICFIPDGDYMDYLLKNGLQPQIGHFRDAAGRDYGLHRGLEAYTIGQRRGLDIACGSRIYVTGKSGTDILVGPNEDLFSDTVQLTDVNWIPFDTLTEPIRAQAKLRYTAKAADCTVYPTEAGTTLVFDEPQRAVTPGQAGVLYQGELLLGGGTIAESQSHRQENE